MNSLQIGLIAIGALVIAILFVWHWWQGGRNRRAEASAERAELKAAKLSEHTANASGKAAESLLEPTASAPSESMKRAEPSLGINMPRSPSEANVETPLASSIEKSNEASEAFQASDAIAPNDASLDGQNKIPNAATVAPTFDTHAQSHPELDHWEVEAGAAVQPRLISTLPFDERLYVHALVSSIDETAFDAAPYLNVSGHAEAWIRLFKQSAWERVTTPRTSSVQELVLALPLASRAGPIKVDALDNWKYGVAEAATLHGGDVQFVGFRDGPERAVDLDGFLAAVDVVSVGYLVKKDGGNWTGTRLRGTLEANGFRLKPDGHFMYHEIETDAEIFALSDGYERPFTSEGLRVETYSALRCSLECANLNQPLARFDVYRQSLRALSKLLDADLKSEDGEALSDEKFAQMREEVKSAMDALSDAGIEPGSNTARVLFS